MKTFYTLALVFIATVFLSLNKAVAGNPKLSQGKIIFDITYPDSPMDEQTLARMPGESVLYFKDDLSRVEVNMSMGTTTIISNHKTGEGTMLMDMMGNKMAIAMNQSEVKKQQSNQQKPEIKKTTETRKIAGYTCTKAVITMHTKEGDISFDAWFTEDLAARNSFSSEIEGLNGFMLEFSNVQNGMNMRMTARSVEDIPVDDSKFLVPEDFQKMSMEDFKRMRQGGK